MPKTSNVCPFVARSPDGQKLKGPSSFHTNNCNSKFQTPEMKNPMWNPNHRSAPPAATSSLMMMGTANDNNAGGVSASIMMPPPPPPATRSSSWFAGYEDPLRAPGIPIMKLALSPQTTTPTKASLPKPQLRKRKSSGTSLDGDNVVDEERNDFSTNHNGKRGKSQKVATFHYDSVAEGGKSAAATKDLKSANTIKDQTEEKSATSVDNPTKRSKPIYDVRDIDVRCGQGDNTKHEGNMSYYSLVIKYGSKLENEGKDLESAKFSELRRKFSNEIVKATRDRGARFLFKKKMQDRKYYDIGDTSAIGKTTRLLQIFVDKQRKKKSLKGEDPSHPSSEPEAVEESSCAIETSVTFHPSPVPANTSVEDSKVGESPDMDELARSVENDLRDPKNSSDPELEAIFQQLTIPERYDYSGGGIQFEMSPIADLGTFPYNSKNQDDEIMLEEGTESPPLRLLPDREVLEHPLELVPASTFTTTSATAAKMIGTSPQVQALQSQTFWSPGISLGMEAASLPNDSRFLESSLAFDETIVMNVAPLPNQQQNSMLNDFHSAEFYKEDE